VNHGIPGSGHTHANHPVYDFIKPLLDGELAIQLEQVLAAANHVPSTSSSPQNFQHIQEISTDITPKSISDSITQTQKTSSSQSKKEQNASTYNSLIGWLVASILLLMLSGYIRARSKRLALKKNMEQNR